jgi:hypothetical protein
MIPAIPHDPTITAPRIRDEDLPVISDGEFDALVRITGLTEAEVREAIYASGVVGANLWEILDVTLEQFMDIAAAWMLLLPPGPPPA